MHAPTASHVRSRVPRFAWKATQSGATTRWSQQLWPRRRRPRRTSLGTDLWALNAPGLPPFHRSCRQRTAAQRRRHPRVERPSRRSLRDREQRPQRLQEDLVSAHSGSGGGGGAEIHALPREQVRRRGRPRSCPGGSLVGFAGDLRRPLPFHPERSALVVGRRTTLDRLLLRACCLLRERLGRAAVPGRRLRSVAVT
jgi:hypothetical protein